MIPQNEKYKVPVLSPTFRKGDAATAYRKQSVLAASPAELIVMLFDGMRRDLMAAETAIKEQRVMDAHNKLINAQQIITELMNALDLNIPVSREIMSYYEYMYRELVTANVKKNAELIPPILEMVEHWRMTWNEVAKTAQGTLAKTSGFSELKVNK